VLVLNKTDLVTEEQLAKVKEILHALNPEANIITVPLPLHSPAHHDLPRTPNLIQFNLTQLESHAIALWLPVLVRPRESR
jgi:G3E family GTPase